MEMLYDMMYIFIDLFSLYCVRLFLGGFLGERKKQKKVKDIFCYILAFLLYSCPNYIFGNPGLNLICSFLACLVLSGIFKGSPGYKMILSLFAVILGMIMELTGTLIVRATDSIQDKAYVLTVDMIAKLIYLVVVKIVCLLAQRKKGRFYTAYYWWMVLFIPIGSVYLVHSSYMRYITLFQRAEEESTIQILLYSCILLIMNILVLWLYDKLNELHEETLRIEQIKIQNTYYVNYFETEQRDNELLKKWKHDIKNYLIGILTLIEAENVNEAKNRIAGKMEEIRSMENMHYSGNAVIDSMMNYKLQRAREQNIKIEHSFCIPKDIGIAADDMAVLFGNALDNALEAVCKVPEEERWITIRMYYERGAVICQMSNLCENVRRVGTHFLSTKQKDGQEHGIGMQSIQSIVEKYQGTMKAEVQNNIFLLEIILYP